MISSIWSFIFLKINFGPLCFKKELKWSFRQYNLSAINVTKIVMTKNHLKV